MGGTVVDRPGSYAERVFAGTSRTGVSKTQGRVLVGNNMAFRREILERYGFDPAMSYYCDEDELAWRLRSDGHCLRHVPGAIVHHHHRLDVPAYLRMARLQGQGSARLWYKTGRYLGRDVALWFVAALLGLVSIAVPPVGRLALATVALQVGVLLFAELRYKGKGPVAALAGLPLVLAYNVTKTLSVALTLARIALGGEGRVRASRRAWRRGRKRAPDAAA